MPVSNDLTPILSSRTTATKVGKIVDIPSGFDISPFIEFANDLVTSACSSVGYSDTKLELLERLLAAHFFASTDFGQESRLKSEDLADWSGTFAFKDGLGLELTTYGQQAMVLDIAGCLSDYNAKIKKGLLDSQFHWLGAERISSNVNDYAG